MGGHADRLCFRGQTGFSNPAAVIIAGTYTHLSAFSLHSKSRVWGQMLWPGAQLSSHYLDLIDLGYFTLSLSLSLFPAEMKRAALVLWGPKSKCCPLQARWGLKVGGVWGGGGGGGGGGDRRTETSVPASRATWQDWSHWGNWLQTLAASGLHRQLLLCTALFRFNKGDFRSFTARQDDWNRRSKRHTSGCLLASPQFRRK